MVSHNSSWYCYHSPHFTDGKSERWNSPPKVSFLGHGGARLKSSIFWIQSCAFNVVLPLPPWLPAESLLQSWADAPLQNHVGSRLILVEFPALIAILPQAAGFPRSELTQWFHNTQLNAETVLNHFFPACHVRSGLGIACWHIHCSQPFSVH